MTFLVQLAEMKNGSYQIKHFNKLGTLLYMKKLKKLFLSEQKHIRLEATHSSSIQNFKLLRQKL